MAPARGSPARTASCSVMPSRPGEVRAGRRRGDPLVGDAVVLDERVRSGSGCVPNVGPDGGTRCHTDLHGWVAGDEIPANQVSGRQRIQQDAVDVSADAVLL